MDNDLKNKAADAIANLKDKAGDLKEKASDFIHSEKVQDGIAKANNFMENGKGREYLDKAKDVAGKVGDKLGDVGDKVKDKLEDIVGDATDGKGLFGFGADK